MATFEDVRRIAGTLPDSHETAETTLAWRIGKKAFAWERPLRRADLTALGDDAPTGPILALYVPDLEDKEALVGDPASACFTTPHFDGYSIVLIDLESVDRDRLGELIVDSWRSRAPKQTLAKWDEKESFHS